MLRMGSAQSKTDKGHLECARSARLLKKEYSTTPGTITKILTDLKWPTIGKFLKVNHLHVVPIALRYAKKGTNM